jgi:hypothetical protein
MLIQITYYLSNSSSLTFSCKLSFLTLLQILFLSHTPYDTVVHVLPLSMCWLLHKYSLIPILFLTCSVTHVYKLTVIYTHSLTHTPTQSLSLSFLHSVTYSLTLILTLPVLSLFHTFYLGISLSLVLSQSHMNLSLSVSHIHIRSLTHTHTHSYRNFSKNVSVIVS